MMSHLTVNQMFRGNLHVFINRDCIQITILTLYVPFMVSLPTEAWKCPASNHRGRLCFGTGRIWHRQPDITVRYELLPPYFYFPYILRNTSFKKKKVALFAYANYSNSRTQPPHIVWPRIQVQFQTLESGARGPPFLSRSTPANLATPLYWISSKQGKTKAFYIAMYF